jgi:hypothetical protein
MVFDKTQICTSHKIRLHFTKHTYMNRKANAIRIKKNINEKNITHSPQWRRSRWWKLLLCSFGYFVVVGCLRYVRNIVMLPSTFFSLPWMLNYCSNPEWIFTIRSIGPISFCFHLSCWHTSVYCHTFIHTWYINVTPTATDQWNSL